jgi:type I restriction enzyme S subunit
MLPNKGGICAPSNEPSGTAIEYKVGDILISNIRPYFQKIWQADCNGACSADVLCIRANNKADSKYLYYLLSQQLFFDYVMAGAKGCKMPRGDKKQIMQWQIALPSLKEQRRIAGILGAIDDKIENNRRINANLELQAQALYKQWFVDNRKDDWEEKQLGEIALHITDGVHNTVIDSPNGEYYLLSCKNIKSGQLFIGSNERRIDHETFTKLRKRTRLSHGDILVTSVGTVGEMYLVNESPSNYEFQRSVAIIKPNNDIISSYFLYAALLYQQNKIKHLAHGAVQQCIFISDLKEYSLIVPNKDDISAFDAVVAPIFNKIGELQKENETLATLRDTLLPKLMNGELCVNDVSAD